MKTLITGFCLFISLAAASCSVIGYAGPIDGGATLKGPSSGATIIGPSGSITATADSGALGVAPSTAGVVSAVPGAVAAPVPEIIPAAAGIVEVRAAPWTYSESWSPSEPWVAPSPWGVAPIAYRTIW